jgi:hypothetical protein
LIESAAGDNALIGVLYWLGITAAVLLNLVAVTLLAQRFIPFPATARAATIAILCLTLFSFEHFVGLGTLHALGLPLTALSLYLIWHERVRLLNSDFKGDQIAFLCAFLYGAVWRLSSPEIVEHSDRLTDFHLVSNYLSGARLPPLDYWLPYQHLNYYYTFQHYSAALLGRLFGLGPGASFNLAAVLLGALVIALAWEFLTLLRVRFSLRLLSVAALAIGGTGVSPLFHLITIPTQIFIGGPAEDSVWHNSRFVGWFETSVTSDAWRALFGDVTQRAIQLPIETFGYQYPLGGYHAVLSGFLLQFMALTIFVAHPLASTKIRARLDFVVGLTVPLTICANAWTLPLQAILVGAWTLWKRLVSGRWDLRYLMAGAGTGVLLLLPFLAGLGVATGHMELQLVHSSQREPLIQFLIVFWPLILLALLVPLAGQVKPLAGFLATVFLALLVCSELFNAFDGGYEGEMLRFNSALKWWGWIFAGGVFSISACLLASSWFAVRLFAAIILVLVSAFVFDSGRLLAARSFSAKIDGNGFYARSRANGRMIEYLAYAPWGIVLEKLYEKRPVDTGIYGSFAEKPSLVGIPWVLRVWKRNLTELPALLSEINRFYAGTHPQAMRFLLEHDVRYVVWSARERKDVETWQSIMKSIDSDYRWMEFSSRPNSHVGLWIRR